MQEDNLHKFFYETIDDELEKKIIEVILKEHDEEVLIDILLKKKKGISKKKVGTK